MFDLTAFGDTFASHSWLWIPMSCAVIISLLLWSGRIRQPGMVNLFLPCINLSMIATGALVAADQLTLDLMALLPF